MAIYELTEAADADLSEIYTYSYREFGEAKADGYFRSLERCFEQLAEFPGIGRPIEHLRPGYFLFRMRATPSILYRLPTESELCGSFISVWTPSGIYDPPRKPRRRARSSMPKI
jgi:plasmid stabilization system protein ParE